MSEKASNVTGEIYARLNKLQDERAAMENSVVEACAILPNVSGYIAELEKERDAAQRDCAAMREEVEIFCREIGEKFGVPILRLGDAACLLGMQFGEIQKLREALSVTEKALCVCLKTFSEKCEGQHNWPHHEINNALAAARKELA